jgi:hypothetical protein
VTLKVVAVVLPRGTARASWLAAAGPTATPALTVREPVAWSVAVKVSLPAVFRVTALLKEWLPLSPALKV